MSLVCLHKGRVYTGFAEMDDCSVLVEDGKIADVFSEKRFAQKRFPADARIIDVDGAYISAGFIDTHIHGTGGFGTDDETSDAVIEMSRILPRYGVTAFNPTLYPSERGRLPGIVRSIHAGFGKESGAQIMGFHLEGPFLSANKLGVQKPTTLSPVDLDYMAELWDAAEGKIVNMTVAPELKNMRELALYCVKKGIVLQAGHTDAAYENMAEGMQAGILHSTHLFNAMSRMDHRNPNAVGAILTHPEISCEIIGDGLHVHPDLFKLLLRVKPIDKITLVTDGLNPTGQEKGPFFANGEEVHLVEGLWRRVADDVIAGSSLTMINGVKNLVDFGFSLEDALKAASSNPAAVMRFNDKGYILPGRDADIVVFDKDFTVLLTIVRGVVKYQNI
ncbi:MAG: N-acetylglucosamine-6-phosphate deacetylase [Spirochaetaceae bacterium]|jgi:N-acetylglucosamine-6-phosphate deacetylase|nr:N-acetylglucosamine-6-phosphate deacetylase [Spirochaetaceae bacterium]